MKLRVPRVLLLVICAELTALAYYLILFTNFGNLYLSTSFGGAALTQGVAVLAIFACVEVMRTEKVTALRALAGAFGAPLVAATLLMFWIGLRRYLEL